MESKVLSAICRYELVSPGDRVICAVSGGADSMALLWCLWLMKEKLGITVEAAHFNHHLRGEESLRDEEFVRKFCDFHDIPLHVGEAFVTAGEKGLEASAREARYGFLRSLGGIIATAHTADDNAETVLMHLIRGSGLRGLGGITPKAEGLIRPMLDVTREEVEEFLAENWISHIEDSSNGTDAFFRNRIRHQIMPLLSRENPSLAMNVSAMAQRLRQEEEVLARMADDLDPTDVEQMRRADPALRRRAMDRLLKQAGLPEPNASHIAQAEALVETDHPSAFSVFPGGVILRRNYGRLEPGSEQVILPERSIGPGQRVYLPEIGATVTWNTGNNRLCPEGNVVIRCRRAGDEITLAGGTKSLKKLFADRKIPGAERLAVPVVADERGVLAVMGIGPNLARPGGECFVFSTADGPSGEK